MASTLATSGSDAIHNDQSMKSQLAMTDETSAVQSDPTATTADALSVEMQSKAEQVTAACKKCDFSELAHLAATKYGFVTDEARKVAWPFLLGCDTIVASDNTSTWNSLDRHRDEDQVALDVDRSFVYYPKHASEKQRDLLRAALSDLITSVLRHHPFLCYFQGYHDIVQVFLLVLGTHSLAAPAVARMSLLRIRDFLLPTISAAESHLRLLSPILYTADPELYHHLSGATKPTPFFALAATLTLYAHDIEDYGKISRLFDFLLASEAAVPVYLFAVIILSRKQELLEVDHDESDMLHSILSKLPKVLDLDDLIDHTVTLFRSHPPTSLPNRTWAHISPNSVLKSTHATHLATEQTLEDGKRLFEAYAEEIRRADMRAKQLTKLRGLVAQYRRPATLATSAILVAAIAVYFGRRTPSHEWTILIQSSRQRLVDLVTRFLHHG